MASVAGMSNAIYVGVDSGGTRTNVKVGRVADGQLSVSATYEVSESLSGLLPKDMVEPVMRTILARLESAIEEEPVEPPPVYVWISAAGYTEWSRPAYLAAMHETMSEILGGRMKRLGAANDGVSLLLGAGVDGVVIAGTGSNTLIRAEDGAIYQAGGHEWVACDFGSGFWIGLRGIRQAYVDFEAGETTTILQRLCEHYNVDIDEPETLVSHLRRLAVGDQDMKKHIARFAVAICGAAEHGDVPAQNIVKEEAESLGNVTATALRRRLKRDRLEGGIRLLECGSLLGDSLFRDNFEAQVQMRLLWEDGGKADISWERVNTAEDACLQLAQVLERNTLDLEAIDPLFRPAIADA